MQELAQGVWDREGWETGSQAIPLKAACLGLPPKKGTPLDLALSFAVRGSPGLRSASPLSCAHMDTHSSLPSPAD